MILVPLLNPKFATALCRTMCANFGFAALGPLHLSKRTRASVPRRVHFVPGGDSDAQSITASARASGASHSASTNRTPTCPFIRRTMRQRCGTKRVNSSGIAASLGIMSLAPLSEISEMMQLCRPVLSSKSMKADCRVAFRMPVRRSPSACHHPKGLAMIRTSPKNPQPSLRLKRINEL